MTNTLKNKAVITAALTGSIHTPSMSPYLPVTAKQLINECLAVYEAGGAVAHIHTRDQKTGLPNADQEVYQEVATEVKKQCDLILCTTTGGKLGAPVEERVRVATTLKPELASLNAGSLNFALFHIADKIQEYKFDWEKPYLEATEDFIFPNTFKTMREFLEIFETTGTKPEFEIYDMGMINNLAYLIRKGIVKKPVYMQFVLGILGGMPATPENLVYLVDTARRQIGDFVFSVCAAGNRQFPMCTQSLILGGNVRVGLEDNLYLESGVLAKSNAEQVAKIGRIARELGIEPATPNEARQILELKGLDKVNF
ncbi:MAG: 3-keto-5-aminohexanoate cleavage protein [Desulfobacula sp.]|uniref:3-keto-5-aminohexanoate cleavage protein n=1 Tax=Desulfobacula sp. TaxID=2593537 RepID=UPI0025C32017|nr:3-keto-5-aminohexanoate cleavage protein [Desulfobacula sp.]MCD4719585.1 3-keto-5-aminohexanoate cleavage protein [Desulfobacula sp.]